MFIITDIDLVDTIDVMPPTSIKTASPVIDKKLYLLYNSGAVPLAIEDKTDKAKTNKIQFNMPDTIFHTLISFLLSCKIHDLINSCFHICIGSLDIGPRGVNAGVL